MRLELRTLQFVVFALLLSSCQMVNVNTGAGTLSSTPATTVSPPVTVPVQVGPGGLPSLPSLPSLPGNVFMLPMPPQPIVVQPPDPIVVKPAPMMPLPSVPAPSPIVVGPQPPISVDPGEQPAGVPPALRAPVPSHQPFGGARFVMWKDIR